MRIGVYGGSFNPPHVGHGMVAAWLRWTDLVDEVWLVPSFSHPFAKELAPFARRVSWCEALAGAVGPWVRVCRVEAELPAPSYSIDMLRELATRHPGASFRLVVGADILPTTAKWRAWDVIERDFSPVVVGRAGYAGPPDVVSFPEVSSTEVRRRLREGSPVGHLVPAAVLRAIGDAFEGR